MSPDNKHLSFILYSFINLQMDTNLTIAKAAPDRTINILSTFTNLPPAMNWAPKLLTLSCIRASHPNLPPSTPSPNDQVIAFYVIM